MIFHPRAWRSAGKRSGKRDEGHPLVAFPGTISNMESKGRAGGASTHSQILEKNSRNLGFYQNPEQPGRERLHKSPKSGLVLIFGVLVRSNGEFWGSVRIWGVPEGLGGVQEGILGVP